MIVLLSRPLFYSSFPFPHNRRKLEAGPSHLVKQFIEAERCGIWELHLETIRKILSFFHATGHFKYAKSAYIFLQDMYKLKDTFIFKILCPATYFLLLISCFVCV